MNAQEFQELLKTHNACEEAVEWANGKTWEQVYNSCHHGDWLLWLFEKTNPDDLRLLTLAKGHCAATVLHLMKDERSKAAVQAAIDFGNGVIDRDALDKASRAAASAYFSASASAAYFSASAAYFSAYADTAASAAASAADAAAASAYAASAASAADAAAYAAYFSAYADTAASAYAYAAYASAAASASAADAAAYAAKKENQKLTADLVRKYIPIESWKI
jgi:hypothetical protein